MSLETADLEAVDERAGGIDAWSVLGAPEKAFLDLLSQVIAPNGRRSLFNRFGKRMHQDYVLGEEAVSTVS